MIVSKDIYRKSVDIVNQDYNLIGALTVKENILLGVEIAQKDHDLKEYERIVSELGLTDLENRKINMLSGGEKQRTAIARALLRGNHVLFADEPTGNLDKTNTDNIYNILKRMSKDHLIIVVSHDLEAAGEYADRIIEIEDGKVKNDEQIRDGENDIDSIDAGLSVSNDKKWIVPYALKGLRHRRKRMIGIVIPVVISMIVAFLALGFFSGVDNRNDEENRAILESDRFSFYLDDYVMQQKSRSMDQNDVETIGNIADFEYVIPFYHTPVTVKYDDKIIYASYQCIDSSEFMRNRYRNIRGSFPENSHDIIIDEKVESFFLKNGVDDCLGKEISINDEVCLRITGIKKSFVSDDNLGYIYIQKELEQEIFVNGIKWGVYLDSNTGSSIDNGVNVQPVLREEYDRPLIQGREISNDDEILVSSAIVNDILYNLRKSNSMREEDILAGKINSVVFGECCLLSDSLVEIGKYSIVGVVDSPERVICLQTYPQCNVINVINAYARNYDDALSDKVSEYCEQSEYGFEESGGMPSMITRNQTILLMIILTIFSVMIFVIAVIITIGFMKISIEQRKYEIGVLKSLGCSKKGIFKLIMTEQMLLSVIICLILAVFCLVINCVGSTGIIQYNGLSIYHNCIWHFGVVAALIFLCVTGVSIPWIIKISASNITGSLAEKYS